MPTLGLLSVPFAFHHRGPKDPRAPSLPLECAAAAAAAAAAVAAAAAAAAAAFAAAAATSAVAAFPEPRRQQAGTAGEQRHQQQQQVSAAAAAAAAEQHSIAMKILQQQEMGCLSCCSSLGDKWTEREGEVLCCGCGYCGLHEETLDAGGCCGRLHCCGCLMPGREKRRDRRRYRDRSNTKICACRETLQRQRDTDNAASVH